MFKKFLLLFLLGHIIGDFYVQTERMENSKQHSMKWFLRHCVYYFIIMCAVAIPVFSTDIFLANVIISVLHMLMELGKYCYIKKLSIAQKRKGDRKIYVVTQLLHIGYLIVMAYYLTIKDVVLCEKNGFRIFMDVIGLPETVVVSWMIIILLLHKPANILIQKLLKPYRPQEDENEIKRDNNAGRFIGTVERIVILVFVSLGEYSAVGLVLTAKSIARYDRISKDKEFAEYYLLGTLISTLIVIVGFCAIKFLGSYG